MKAQKILIVRFSSIGDIVLTTPVIRCLKKQLHADVHFLTKKSFAPLLAANPYLSKIHVLENSLAETIQNLRAEKFDVVIDLHHNFRTFWLKLFCGAPSFSFKKLNIEKWLLVNFKINKLPKVHIVDRYLETCAPLGVQNDGQGLDYFFSPDTTIPSEIFAKQQQPFIAWVIGAKFQTKKYPVQKVVQTLKRSDFPDFRVVLLGGKEDIQEAAAIQQAYDGPLELINLCGKLSLNESAKLVETATAVIANDTGLMHIAAAFKKPILSVWGNTVPDLGMTPYYGHHHIPSQIAEVKGLSCRPCSKIGFQKCPKGHFKCMLENELPLNFLRENL